MKDSPLLSDKIMEMAAANEGPKMISITPFGKEEKAVSVVYKSALDSSYLALPSMDYSGQKNIYR